MYRLLMRLVICIHTSAEESDPSMLTFSLVSSFGNVDPDIRALTRALLRYSEAKSTGKELSESQQNLPCSLRALSIDGFSSHAQWGQRLPILPLGCKMEKQQRISLMIQTTLTSLSCSPKGRGTPLRSQCLGPLRSTRRSALM